MRSILGLIAWFLLIKKSYSLTVNALVFNVLFLLMRSLRIFFFLSFSAFLSLSYFNVIDCYF